MDYEELKVEHKREHAYTVFVAVAMYSFFFVITLGIKYRRRRVRVQDYQVLEDH